MDTWLAWFADPVGVCRNLDAHRRWQGDLSSSQTCSLGRLRGVQLTSKTEWEVVCFGVRVMGGREG